MIWVRPFSVALLIIVRSIFDYFGGGIRSRSKIKHTSSWHTAFAQWIMNDVRKITCAPMAEKHTCWLVFSVVWPSFLFLIQKLKLPLPWQEVQQGRWEVCSGFQVPFSNHFTFKKKKDMQNTNVHKSTPNIQIIYNYYIFQPFLFFIIASMFNNNAKTVPNATTQKSKRKCHHGSSANPLSIL